MSRDKRVKNRKPCTDMINCHNCNNCTYIGEGDYICDMTTEVVISEWQPTEDYYSCEGKDFENI